MPKKVKRNVSTVARPAPAPQVMEVETATAEAAPSARGSAASSARPASFSRRSATTEFNPDYTYVIKDLKRIGTLAGTFFVLLIVLSFIIR